MKRYIAISIRKMVKDKDEAQELLDCIRERCSDLKEVEVTAQYVDRMMQELTSPHPEPE